MNTIPEMIDVLKSNPEVVGLIEYGSAQFSAEVIHGDYDIVVVVEVRDPDVESLHFHIGDVPIDLNIRSLDDIRDTCYAEGFDSILLDGKIIHDPTGILEKEIKELKQRDAKTPKGPGNLNIPGIRHGHKHILDKVRERRESMPTLSSYLLHQGIYWLVRQYFEVRNLEFKGDKYALEFIQEHEPRIFELIEKFYQISELTEKTELFRSTAEAILAPVGGLWRIGEVLVFGNQKKGQEFYHKLFDIA